MRKMRKIIFQFFTDVGNKSSDILFFYYSGYIIQDLEGHIYLAPTDTYPDKPIEKGVHLYDLAEIVRKATSMRVVIILDCFLSGGGLEMARDIIKVPFKEGRGRGFWPKSKM